MGAFAVAAVGDRGKNQEPMNYRTDEAKRLGSEMAGRRYKFALSLAREVRAKLLHRVLPREMAKPISPGSFSAFEKSVPISVHPWLKISGRTVSRIWRIPWFGSLVSTKQRIESVAYAKQIA